MSLASECNERVTDFPHVPRGGCQVRQHGRSPISGSQVIYKSESYPPEVNN